MKRTMATILALGVSVGICAGCSPEPEPQSQPQAESALPALAPDPGARPDVVLIVLDTLRPDHLPCYGYERATSPNIDDLCAKSTVYENAYAASSWTLPSHASLFTGLHPIRHGTHHENRVLAEHHETLAEAMSAAGYRTHAIIANAMLARDRKLDQGFGSYTEAWRKAFDQHPKLFPDYEAARSMPWDDVDDPLFRAAMQQLRPGVDENAYFGFRRSLEEESPAPVFLFVNLVGVHSPYNSSGPFYEKFLRHPELELEENRWPEYYTGRADFPDDQLEHFVDLYDAEILHADHIVGRMIEDLQATGRWANTLLIVTSDHGENLGDHGHLSHVFSLHETLTRVPLIVHFPPRFPAATRIRSRVSGVDLFPTILEAAGIELGARDLDGTVLVRRDAEPRARALISEYYYPWENIRFVHQLFGDDTPGLERWQRRLRSITVDDMKLIWASDGRHELYDLAADPDERHDLIDDPSRTQIRDALIERLEAFVAGNGGPTPLPAWDPAHPNRAPGEADLDPETVRQLEELGYL